MEPLSFTFEDIHNAMIKAGYRLAPWDSKDGLIKCPTSGCPEYVFDETHEEHKKWGNTMGCRLGHMNPCDCIKRLAVIRDKFNWLLRILGMLEQYSPGQVKHIYPPHWEEEI